MFISFHVQILCMYHILSSLVYFHITYLIPSCTFIYILILFIYGTFICFNPVLFMYYTFICLLLVSSLSSFISITYYILCTITYIISYPVPISCILSCSGYTLMLYFLFFIFILVLSYTFILYVFILYFLYTVILYYSYTSYTFVRSYSIIYFILSYTFCTFLVLV